MIVKSYEGRDKLYTPTCDQCGTQLTEQYDFYDAVESKKAAGWSSKKIGGKEWIDLCPDCASEFRDDEHPSASSDFGGVV